MQQEVVTRLDPTGRDVLVLAIRLKSRSADLLRRAEQALQKAKIYTKESDVSV